MISGNELRPGTVVEHEGRVWIVESSVRAGTAQRRASFHVKMRDARTGENLQTTFQDDDSFEEPALEKHEAQYTYRKGKDIFFLDQTTYEEHGLSETALGPSRHFLLEGETYRLILIDGAAVGVELPSAVTLTVAECAPPIKGDGNQKDAVLDTGLRIKVPAFLKQGEKVRVSTETLEYLGKA